MHIHFTDFNWNGEPPKINISAISVLKSKPRPTQAEPEVNTEELIEEAEDDVLNNRAFVDNLEDFYQMTHEGVNESDTGMVETQDPDTPHGFVSFIRDNVLYYLRKSTLLWMITSKKDKVSNDRLRRFINENKKSSTEESIQLGDFIVMEVNGKEVICQVLGFKYINENYAFKGISCPIKHEGGSGVDVQIFQFRQQGTGFLTAHKKRDCFVNIEQYLRHVSLKRDNKSERYILA